MNGCGDNSGYGDLGAAMYQKALARKAAEPAKEKLPEPVICDEPDPEPDFAELMCSLEYWWYPGNIFFDDE